MKKILSIVFAFCLLMTTSTSLFAEDGEGGEGGEGGWYAYILSCGRVIYDPIDEIDFEVDDDYFADQLEEYELLFCEVPNSQNGN